MGYNYLIEWKTVFKSCLLLMRQNEYLVWSKGLTLPLIFKHSEKKRNNKSSFLFNSFPNGKIWDGTKVKNLHTINDGSL